MIVALARVYFSDGYLNDLFWFIVSWLHGFEYEAVQYQNGE